MKHISLRKYGYRMDESKKVRHRVLKAAIEECGIKRVVSRLEQLRINARYTKQTQRDINYCLIRSMTHIKIEKDVDECKTILQKNDFENLKIE